MLDDLDAQKQTFYTFWKSIETEIVSEKILCFYCKFSTWKIKYWAKTSLNKQAQ